ncbi:hypothetical protein Q8A73_009703 [Channa argus]|nr:hypothetical protein Q8A73_009703 [Channa argus]
MNGELSKGDGDKQHSLGRPTQAEDEPNVSERTFLSVYGKVWDPGLSTPQHTALQSFSHGLREGGESAGLSSPRLGTVSSSAILTVCTSPEPGSLLVRTVSGKERGGLGGERLYFYSLWIYKVPLPAGGGDTWTHPQRSKAVSRREFDRLLFKPFSGGFIFFSGLESGDNDVSTRAR